MNKISTIGRKDFRSLKELRKFSMEGCSTDIKELELQEGIFSENTDLETITISRCEKLEDIKESVHLTHLPLLKEVSFHGCSLKSLPESLLPWEDLALLDLSSNPISCNCDLLGIILARLRNQDFQIVGQCRSPNR